MRGPVRAPPMRPMTRSNRGTVSPNTTASSTRPERTTHRFHVKSSTRYNQRSEVKVIVRQRVQTKWYTLWRNEESSERLGNTDMNLEVT